MVIKYIIGKKPQYESNRWKRYESLRSCGFMKWEARELSKNKDVNNPAIKTMVASRVRLVNRVLKTAGESDSDGKVRYAFYSAVHKFYLKNKLLNAAGLPDVRVFYHVAENKEARSRGWKKGEFDRKRDAGEATDGVAPRRRGKKPGSGKGRWQTIKAAKARARARAGFYKITGSKVSDASTPVVRQWISHLNVSIKESKGQQREQFIEQRDRLRKLVK